MFSPINPLGWALYEELTSAQMNSLDADHANAVDRQVGALEVDSYTVTRVQALNPTLGPAASASDLPNDFDFDPASLGWIQQAASSYLYIPISNVADRGTMTAVRLILKGSAGPGGAYTALPGALPTLRLEWVDTAGVAQASGVTATDGSANVAAFNLKHSITHSSTPIAFDQTATPITPYVKYGGVGAGFEADKLGLLRVEADFTVTRLSPGG